MAYAVEPVRVSPFIKTDNPSISFSLTFPTLRPWKYFTYLSFKWSLLITGIFYGSTRYAALSKKQNAIRENYARDKPKRDALAALEKKRKEEEDILLLAQLSGTKEAVQ